MVIVIVRAMLQIHSDCPNTQRGLLPQRARGKAAAAAAAARVAAPSYVTAVVAPPRAAAPRHFCSVCGQLAKYTCTRCASRYCSRRCNTTHTETRCLKFIA